ncbi:MAG: hypothetical protein NC393_14805, partial [Clostridium sp.]|nr:hypothetical protein [Clostridium sp.]
ICVSNLPSAAVEPNAEMTQEEMQYALETSEAVTEEATEEVTETTEEKMQVTTEEVTEETTKRDEDVTENSTSTKTVVANESVDASKVTNADAVSGNGNSSEKTSTDLNDDKNGQGDENGIAKADTVNVDADTDTAGVLEDGEASDKKCDEDMMLSGEKNEKVAADNETDMELLDEDISEEELLAGAEVDKLEKVVFDFDDMFSVNNNSAEKTTYSFSVGILNNNDFDIYLSCMRCYVTDEKGNEYTVPISISVMKLFRDEGQSGWDTKDFNITNNDPMGYLGYDDESVLTDESILVSPTTDLNNTRYSIKYTIPAELEGSFSAHIYAEYVRLDDATSKVVASYSQTDTCFLGYNRVINKENSNYDIKENCSGDFDNVDINIYHDGNYLTAEAEANFYIQISNHNDYDLLLREIRSCWARTVLDLRQGLWHNNGFHDEGVLDYVHSNGMQIIDANGKNIVNHCCDSDIGYDNMAMLIALEEWIFIRAGETVTYKVNCTLSSDDNGKLQPIDFIISLRAYYDGGLKSDDNDCTYRCDFIPFGNTPTVSIDKADETTPDLKLDDEAYDELINSVFTEAEIKSGKHLKVDLIVAALSEASVGQSDLEAIKTAAKKRKIAVILDMNIVKFIDGIVSGNVNKLDKEITITIDVPKEFQAANRKFSIIRLHDGIAEELPDLDDNPNTVTFTTGKFSFYTLIYEDAGEGTALEPPKNDTPSTVEPAKNNADDANITPADNTKQTASPNTGDMAPIAVVFILMLVSAILVVICTKKVKRNNK